MNSEYKKRRASLVKALRSGKYKQGKRQLRLGDHFCCLGVACDISGLGTWKLYNTSKYSYEYDVITSLGEYSMLPDVVRDYYGFSGNNGSYNDPEGIRTSLISKNDRDFSFEKIADIIESEPKGLFNDN